MSNVEAAQSGNHRQALERVRDTLATAIDLAAQRGDGTVAQLAAQYRGVLAEIAVIDKQTGEGVSELDRIRARREARSGTTADHPPAARRRKSSNR